MLAVHTDKQDT